jgi:hypothetical protein
MEELFREMAKRGRQENLSFFAFTATPKYKTFAVFGRDKQHFHRYTMRQAIEERFIMDVLKSYTTYATYFRLLKACGDDPHVERRLSDSAPSTSSRQLGRAPPITAPLTPPSIPRLTALARCLRSMKTRLSFGAVRFRRFATCIRS